jgi:hypothetical protein
VNRKERYAEHHEESGNQAEMSFDSLNPAWFLFTAFVGLNLFQSAFTNWCPMMTILRKLSV